MPYWVAQCEVAREHVAERFLQLAGYSTYCPRLRERGAARPLFPSYVFIVQALQWYRARWSIGVLRLIAQGSGGEPAAVPDAVVDAIRKREHNGLVVLPSPREIRHGDRVRIVHGPLTGLEGLVEGLRPQRRVEILLAVLGRVELAKGDIAAVEI
jgi:transcription antitermination factor NusG